MAMDDSERTIDITREEDDFDIYPLQLRLAASILKRVAERNGGCGAAEVFFDDDSDDEVLDREEYLDPELWDPEGVETLPEMDIIYENIF